MTSAYPLVSHISIHALREEGDGFGTILRRGMVAFLSTPSARRATMILIWYMNADEDFYPRPPRGGRPGQQTANDTPIGISIHALREEGDVRLLYQRQPPCGFLSTPSARRATKTVVDDWRQFFYFYPRPPRGGRLRRRPRQRPVGRISIHALREEGDRARDLERNSDMIFLSTPSARRATWQIVCRFGQPLQFLSTPSARRATCGAGR